MTTHNDDDWFEDYAADENELEVESYDITSSPNDFNILTIFNFIESGAIAIPGFQRNFVWDIGRSSKLIESLLLGLPVPQLFLYEEGRNKFLVIDGQQRMMSIYYFIKQRFPRKEKRAELRKIFEEHNSIPDDILYDDEYFTNFKLSLPGRLPDRPNQFNGLNYATLGEDKFQFDLRPIRNVVIKQNSPKDDDSSIYEIFSRLNSGGVNLRPQEIRLSLYHSSFYEMLQKINARDEWRRLLGMSELDLHMKDVEILLRAFAMLIDGTNYSPSMIKFLNQFSKKAKAHDIKQNQYLESIFDGFLASAKQLPDDIFINKGNNRFNVALFEAVFSTTCSECFEERRLPKNVLSSEEIKALSMDVAFTEAASKASTSKVNVGIRAKRAQALIGKL